MALWSNTDATDSEPKNLTSTEKETVFGLDVAESQTAVNQARGLNTPGWVKYTTYTDAQSNVRHKSEVLVAISTITGDNDTIAPEITISTPPSSTSVIAPATATFTVAATRTGAGTLAYQWQIQQEGAGAWADVTTGTGGTTTSYTTGATAIGDGAGATDGDKYRVIVSLAGAESVTSAAATLTVTAS